MNQPPIPAQDGIDPDALQRKYQQERRKRLTAQASPYTPVGRAPAASASDGRAPLADEVDVVVVGGGFTGLITAARLRESGIESVRIIEKGDDFGGVWFWNRYPGVRCDVDAYIYLPLLEEVGTVPTEKYAEGREIFAHCQALATKYGLYDDACLGTQVTELRWEQDTARWVVSTDRGDSIRARHVCLGSGVLDLPKIPAVEGITEFAGHSFHSSRWDYDYTGGDSSGGLTGLKGKRVAVVGTAASAVQCIPVIAEYADELYVVQRTPSIVDARENKATDVEWYRNQPAGWQRERMDNFTALTSGVPQEVDLVDDRTTRMLGGSRPAGEPQASKEEAAQRMLSGNYAKMEELRARVDAIVDDAETAESLKPYYNLGCKRPQFSDVYYETFNRGNVHLVDTRGRGLEAMTREGIVAGGEEHAVDCVIFATGFAGGVPITEAGGFEIHGREQTLTEKWKTGVRSLHGMYTHGFPNLFVIGGINQAVLTLNFTHVLDRQSRHMADVLLRGRLAGADSIEVTEDAERRWTALTEAKSVSPQRELLDCTPSDQLDLFNSSYGGGPVEYFDILDRWLRDEIDRDLVFHHLAG
ncbi:flavin-containing monooxygenase [Lentzea sp. NPDC060358]|uniref:flavin-containing monooxygenase n=1 Tax=Lentzea sp. NPDC060358 TaxID=3347103 RepID=UPI003662781F